MIALAYLAVLIFLGDAVARRWFTFVSLPHRLATAFLVGLLLATWVSYLTALLFAGTGDPVALGALVSAAAMVGAATWLRRQPAPALATATRSTLADWAAMLSVGVVVGWMMISTYSFDDGTLRIAGILWSDFGPTTAIAQSIALGHNVPTEYPHFALEPIRYHFLYYYQVGNLTYLGLDPATANNVLSVGSVVAMLVVVSALGERLFGSRWVGWIGATLFFFHGSLSFIPYLASFPSLDQALASLPSLDRFLSSGFPYRGEEWGIWTQAVFLNQRHLPSAIGILLCVVLFVLDRVPGALVWRRVPTADDLADEPSAQESATDPTGLHPGPAASFTGDEPRGSRSLLSSLRRAIAGTVDDPWLPGYALCGVLAGSLPLYNGAMFISAAVVLAALLVLLPNRRQMLVLAVAAAVPAIPQLIFLRPGTMAGAQTYPSFWWGYTIDDPTPVRVATYLAFIFGPKLLLVGVALLAGNSMQRRVFIAFTSLLALAFLVQFSPEVLANHKFINMWLIVANIFAAFGLAWLWRVRGVARQPARLAAAGLALVIVTGGAIDLIPVKNQRIYEVSLTGDPLYEWVRTETRPNDIFLSDIHVVDRILLAGRRLYLGWPYFAWSAGYDVRAREQIYRELFATRSARDLVRRLQAIGIDYVAFDDGLRDRGYAPRLNEELFRAHMEAAFTDPDNRYGHLAIYRVPTNPATADTLPGAPVEYMYAGGDGITAGLFGEPRGLALDRWGAVYVVDTADRRVGRFSSSGNLLSWLGAPGADPVRFDRPTGVAVGSKGVVHVADEGRLRSFESSGASAGEWTGPDVPFADLADVAIDGADRLFVLDAGNGRVVRRDPDGTTITWGGVGGADGQLRDPTGLAVGAGKVAVADVGNARLVLFDDAGRFLQAWPVPEWQGHAAYGADVAIDAAGTIRASSPGTNAVLVFRPDGTLAGTLTPSGADALDGPTGLVGTPGGHLFVANARSGRVVLLVHPNP